MKPKPDWLAILSCILGIVSLITSIWPGVAVPTIPIGLAIGVAALIFGVKTRGKEDNPFAVAGVVTGICGMCISLTVLILWANCVATAW